MNGKGPEAQLRQRFSVAVAAQQAGDPRRARSLYEALLEETLPDALRSDICSNLGPILRDHDDFDAAELRLEEAVRLAPANHGAVLNLANFLTRRQRYAEAEAAYLRAMALKPPDRSQLFNLSTPLLGQGKYDAGFAFYELRPDREQTPLRQLSFPEWDGSPLRGRSVLVWREQGYGDELMMARFIRQLKANGAGRVTVAPTVALIRLFSTLDGVDEVMQAVGEVTIPRHDVWVLPASLPHKLGVRPETVGAPAHLFAPDAARDRWRGFAAAKGAGRKTIGAVWHGNPKQPVERYRGLPSADLLAPLAEHGALIDLQTPRGDFADTAAILEQLDLVVTTDTAMAHLAGALGKPCWVMLTHFACDWRWGPEGDSTPWYPTLRLWRRRPDGDWNEVIARMAAELASNPL